MQNRGFTLVELLAVIVILAVISLIATPMVLGVIEKSKKSAAIESVNGILDAAEKYIIEGMITGENTTKFDLSIDTSLSYKGEKPESGTLLIDDNGKMSIKAKINGYCIIKTYNGTTPTIVDNSICEGNYKEEILNGTDPVLKDSLVPVTIKDNGEVTYADTSMEWYDYENKIWANAVILVDSPSKSYSVGDTILEDDIESYFVWIPKYSYKLWDLGNYDSNTKIDKSKVHSIDIVFGTTNSSDTKEGECTTPLISGESGNCIVGDYMTHPAFITLEVNGIWIGKFDTTGDTTQLTVKPNNVSIRYINMSSMFHLALNYEMTLSSHMMKNTEWGAVAYLTHSKYGINKELNINNNNQYLTGYSSLPSLNQKVTPGISGVGNLYNKAYNTEIGYLASTTGNISGIYDMRGGANTYMAAYMDGELGSSDLTQETINANAKYFDKYSNNSTIISYNQRILGDATGEIGPFEYYLDTDTINRTHTSWYESISGFVLNSYPWLYRGGNPDYGSLSGLFSFAPHTGAGNSDLGFRLVLAP